jgi:hypothetical protein
MLVTDITHRNTFLCQHSSITSSGVDRVWLAYTSLPVRVHPTFQVGERQRLPIWVHPTLQVGEWSLLRTALELRISISMLIVHNIEWGLTEYRHLGMGVRIRGRPGLRGRDIRVSITENHTVY